MNITWYSFLVILGCGAVTWLSRIVPFLLVRRLYIPSIVLRFLSYVPICILTVLFAESLLIKKESAFPAINIEYLLVSLPTILTAIITKNLMWIVIAGVVTMSLIRYFDVLSYL